MWTAKIDQTAKICRLIEVFVVCTYHFVAIAVSQLKRYLILSTTWPTKWAVHPAKTRISLGINPVWSESLLCALGIDKDPRFLHGDNEDWSDWTDLSLCWAHWSFCWFCLAGAHFLVIFIVYFTIVIVISLSLFIIRCTVINAISKQNKILFIFKKKVIKEKKPLKMFSVFDCSPVCRLVTLNN